MGLGNNKRILVLGDAMLDQYCFGNVNRISPEAPIPVFNEKTEVRFSPGGAANVAVNLSAIGVDTAICAVVGCDESGKMLVSLLNDSGVDTSTIYQDKKRVTTRKLRYIGQNNQQILRVDKEETDDISEETQRNTLDLIKEDIDKCDMLLISDYSKGMLPDDFTQEAIKLAVANGIPVFVDVKGDSPKKYKNATLLKPNRKELYDLTGMPVESVDDVTKAAERLCECAGCVYILATLGADGMILVGADGLIKHIRSVANEIFDVTGAGDTSLAYLAAEYVKGKSVENAMMIANVAAGIQVSKVGTCIIDPAEVLAAMRGIEADSSYDNHNIETVLADIERRRSRGEKVVFTNGCFDILHAGHITCLNEAKKMGDILVVGVNDDQSVKRLKGEDRPINTVEDRMNVLESLKSVDYVVPFSEDTPIELIKCITPDVLVKGGDYKENEIVGADFVKEHGGKVVVIPYIEGKSTSETISRIYKRV